MPWETTDDQGLSTPEVVVVATSSIAIIMTSIAATVLIMCLLGIVGLACFQKQKQRNLRERLRKFNNKVENLENVNDLEMLPRAESREEPSSEMKLMRDRYSPAATDA